MKIHIDIDRRGMMQLDIEDRYQYCQTAYAALEQSVDAAPQDLIVKKNWFNGYHLTFRSKQHAVLWLAAYRMPWGVVCRDLDRLAV